jgi:hypothetical protein
VDAALKLYAEAIKIAASCESGSLHPVFLAALQGAIIKICVGDYKGALSDTRALQPLALQIAQEWPALFHVYLNAIAVALVGNDRSKEAARFCDTLRTSRFRDVYPELGRTGDDLALALRTPSRMSIDVGKVLGGAEAAPSEIAPAGPLPRAVEPTLVASVDRAAAADPGQRRQAEARPNVKPRARTPRAPSIFLATQSFIRLVTQQARVGMGKRNPARSRTFRWSNLRRYPARPRAP